MNYRLCLIALAVASPVSAADPAVLAATIDRHVEAKLRAENLSPAPPADDAAFFRRVNLSLAGRIPEVADVRAFLADRDPDKRTKAVDRLLASPTHTEYMTRTWRGWLIPEADSDQQVAANATAFEAWLRSRLKANTPFDKMVTELLIAPLDGRQARGAPKPAEDEDPNAANGPLVFYTAKEGKPENLAAATSRVFLGVRLECAQCHNHPFAKWSREQFWGLAAFYGGVERSEGGGLREVLDRREMLIPSSDRTAPAAFLDDSEPEWRYKKSPRVTLAAWVTAPDNPFFARAMANRMWEFLFGVGLVDPVDDFHDQNPPSHPELLDALARAFVESGFDTKFLIRAICRSETYRRASGTTDPGRRDDRLFARFPVQGLTADQLYDSLAVVIGPPEKPPADPKAPRVVQAQADPGRRQFAELFALSGRKTDTPTSVSQALALMNGSPVGTATTEGSRTLAAALTPPKLSPAERVEVLYLSTLGRLPTADELKRTMKYVEAGDSGQSKARHADVLWALLNGVEFRTNH